MSYRATQEMHKTVCTDCGEECEVPFKPDPRRPIFCPDCLAKGRPVRRSGHYRF